MRPAGTGADQVRPGVLIADRYRLVKRIGKGGMAEVWSAIHEELRTEVAIKFLSSELSRQPDLAPLALARFRFEAQVSARLAGRTRHVVSVHDAGTHKGTPYLAMELVSGLDLEQEVAKAGPLDPGRVAALLDQVADALDTAHSMGIVHRDMKPSNILLTGGDGGGELFVKVADFGVAKATRAGAPFDLPRVTAHGMLVGSPAYMSPEQAEGKSDVGAASDVWSLGTVVYEALSGRACFDGESLTAVLFAVAVRKFTPLSQVRPELGKGIDRWLDRCLAMDPARRFQTVAEMSQAFRKAIGATERKAFFGAAGRKASPDPAMAALEPSAASGKVSPEGKPHDVRQSLPHDVRQSLPHDVRQSLPRERSRAALVAIGVIVAAAALAAGVHFLGAPSPAASSSGSAGDSAMASALPPSVASVPVSNTPAPGASAPPATPVLASDPQVAPSSVHALPSGHGAAAPATKGAPSTSATPSASTVPAATPTPSQEPSAPPPPPRTTPPVAPKASSAPHPGRSRPVKSTDLPRANSKRALLWRSCWEQPSPCRGARAPRTRRATPSSRRAASCASRATARTRSWRSGAPSSSAPSGSAPSATSPNASETSRNTPPPGGATGTSAAPR